MTNRDNKSMDDINQEIVEIITRGLQEDLEETELFKVKEYLENNPNKYLMIYDLADVLENKMIEQAFPNPIERLFVKDKMKHIRREMDYDNSTMHERMLIDNLLINLLRTHWMEMKNIEDYPIYDSPKFLDYWEKWLTTTQLRFLRAWEAYTRNKRLSLKTPALKGSSEASGQLENNTDDLNNSVDNND